MKFFSKIYDFFLEIRKKQIIHLARDCAERHINGGVDYKTRMKHLVRLVPLQTHKGSPRWKEIQEISSLLIMSPLDKWAYYLSTLSDEGYNQASYSGRSRCAAGYLPEIFREWHTNHQWLFPREYPTCRSCNTVEDVVDFFGITLHEASNIVCRTKGTRTEAIEKIKKLAKDKK